MSDQQDFDLDSALRQSFCELHDSTLDEYRQKTIPKLQGKNADLSSRSVFNQNRYQIVAIAASLLLVIGLAISVLMSWQDDSGTNTADRGEEILTTTTLKEKDNDENTDDSNKTQDDNQSISDVDQREKEQNDANENTSNEKSNDSETKSTLPKNSPTTTKPNQTTTTTSPTETLEPITNFRVVGSRVDGGNTIVTVAWDQYPLLWTTTLCFSVNSPNSCTHNLSPIAWFEKEIWFVNSNTGPHTFTIYAYDNNGNKSPKSTLQWSF